MNVTRIGVPADCCDALKIITRAEWGARDPKTTLNIAVPVSTFFIHHTDTYGCETQDVCSARVRSIQRYHMEVKTVDNLIECGVHRGKIKPSYTLQGHRDAKQSKTKCPGDALYREIQTWNNYPDSGKTVERDIRESPQGPPDQEGHLELCDASGKFCGWNQDGPLFWSKRHGEADWAGKTGPSSDSTGSLTGDYLLADATDSTAYKSVKIYSDHYPYDSSANSLYCVDFQYHMFGQDVGTLSLKLVLDDRYRKTVWHLSGDHGNRWIRKRFEFIATFRGSYLGDIALDNIRIGKGRCEM
ncbi:MLRP2-like protein, partial [Mya arenaria]